MDLAKLTKRINALLIIFRVYGLTLWMGVCFGQILGYMYGHVEDALFPKSFLFCVSGFYTSSIASTATHFLIDYKAIVSYAVAFFFTAIQAGTIVWVNVDLSIATGVGAVEAEFEWIKVPMYVGLAFQTIEIGILVARRVIKKRSSIGLDPSKTADLTMRGLDLVVVGRKKSNVFED